MKFSLSQKNSNSLFMVMEKMLLTIINFAVFTTIARFLGVENMGLFSLVQVFLIIGLPIALFVNEQAMIRFVLDETSSTNVIFKHACILKFISSILVYLTSVTLAYLFYGETIALYAALFCFVHLVNYDIIFFSYFRAYQNSGRVFKIKILTALGFAVIKIFTVLSIGELKYVFFIYALEAFSLGSWAFISYFKSNKNQILFSAPLEKRHFSSLIKTSIPLIGSAVVITLYSRIDQLMINSILGTAALGQYAIGVKLSESSTMLLGAFFASRFPMLLQKKAEGLEIYNIQIVQQLQLSLILGASLLVTMIFLSGDLINILFGEQYLEAAPVLVVHMTGAIFIYYGMICTQWLIAEKLEIYRFYRVLVGLALNVVLNILWIEKYGIIGAAYATAISQIGSNVFFNATSKKTLPFFKLQLISFNPLVLIKNTKDLRR